MAAKKRKIRKIKNWPSAISNSYILEKPDFSLFARPSFWTINWAVGKFSRKPMEGAECIH